MRLLPDFKAAIKTGFDTLSDPNRSLADKHMAGLMLVVGSVGSIAAMAGAMMFFSPAVPLLTKAIMMGIGTGMAILATKTLLDDQGPTPPRP